MKYFSISEGINGARLPHFGQQTPPELCRIYALWYMAQAIEIYRLFGNISGSNRHNLARGISVYISCTAYTRIPNIPQIGVFRPTPQKGSFQQDAPLIVRGVFA